MNDSRLELKYLFNSHYTNKLIRILKTLPYDLKEKFNSRHVNNIYFDTQNNNCLKEHLDGIKNRYKIRIRWYGEFKDFLKPILEFKIKKNKITIKQKIKIKTDNEIDYLSNKQELHKLLKETLKKNKIINFSNNFKISRIISYQRNYYESLNEKIRFTVDQNLIYKVFNTKGIIVKESSRKFYQKDFNILELKCDYIKKDLVPFIEKKILIKNQSFSKFIDYRY